MRYLVLGCNGMAGHIISIYLQDSGHSVIGFARQKSNYVDTIVGDALDFSFLKGIIRVGGYDAVINCVGVLNHFAESNPARAIMLNGYLPHYLAHICQDMCTKVVQISTDCVFSGKTGKYTEFSPTDGNSIYDRTKAIGELNDNKNITLRTSIVGPDINYNGIGLLNWFMKQNGIVYGYTKAIWTGQTTLQLARTIEIATTKNAYGLYNIVPDNAISKYELLQLLNDNIRKTKIEIIPKDDINIDKSLIRTRMEGFNYEIPDYHTMISELGEWMRNHKELYPHYYL